MSLETSQLKEIHESLEQFGLSAAEREAYLALLSLGITTASPLSQRLKIPLTTAQSLLKRLGQIGVAHVTKRKSRSVYEAKDPIVFKKLLEQRLQEISQAIPLMASLKADMPKGASIRVYERERVTDIFRQALNAKEKMIYEIVSAKDLQDVLGERFHFSQRRAAAGIRLRSLRVEAREIKKYSKEKHTKELREAKFLPREFTFQCSVMFWDDTIAFFSPANESMAWMMRSTSFVTMMTQIFEMLWSLGRKMETG